MNKLALLLVFALAIHTVTAFNLIEENDINDDRVKIDFYFESLCPYCQQYIVGALKTAANTKVSFDLFRISGKSVTLIFILTAMLKDSKVVQAGLLLVNMEFVNVKEI